MAIRTARYAKLRDRSLAIVDRTFAEPVYLSFFKDEELDPSRPAMEIEAVLRVGGGKITNASGGSDRTWRVRIAPNTAELHINRAQWPVPKFIVGDKVKAISREGTPWFEVRAIDDREFTRLVLQLGEA